MSQEVKTVALGTGVDQSNGELTHNESNGEWYVEGLRLHANGDRNGSTAYKVQHGVIPDGTTISAIDINDTDTVSEYSKSASGSSEHYVTDGVSVDYVDFDNEQYRLSFAEDDGGTFDVYLHLRRVV